MSKGLRMLKSSLLDGLQACGGAVWIGGGLHRSIGSVRDWTG